jgi:hypothetical protein
MISSIRKTKWFPVFSNEKTNETSPENHIAKNEDHIVKRMAINKKTEHWLNGFWIFIQANSCGRVKIRKMSR